MARLPLRRSLRAGAVYDILLGFVIVATGPGLLRALGHPLSDGALFYFHLASLPLWILPVLYWTASRAVDPDPFRGPVLWARGAGGAAILFLVFAIPPEVRWIFAAIGVIDLGWAVLHAALWRRSA